MPVFVGRQGEAGEGGVSLCMLVVLHPRERLSLGLLAQTVCAG